ncbi:YlqD family protein [Gloeobacter morelensis]|uniref:YlqD family protein n=1 Tax=Gloeobacter morelensis MG652769 TaxID=2781736 RepID=A0ABY3PL03_9CYAN|nr:YlqD family protein [Gloeobacter morelensis]UFP94333.1 YlqD family protein [Gloeobacter morelensis MG652769]
MKLNIKRNVTIKAIVTPRLKEEMMAQLQGFLSQADRQLEQLEFQGKRAIAEIERTNIKPLGPEAKNQIENIRTQVNEQKNQLLQQKNQFLQQLSQVTGWELAQEVVQGQVESYFDIQAGDNLVEKMNVEVLIEDGIVKEIRGEP